MSILIFIIILAILILVHEFGHFWVARRSGIKVEEFGIGFPPRLFTLFKWKETKFTFNTIPFGGFVKIFGENPDEESISGPESGRSFVNKPKWVQALVLFAGVAFNVIFAWILISFGFMAGLPASNDYEGPGEVRDVRVLVLSVMEDSPAEVAGLRPGDNIISVSSGEEVVEVSSHQEVSDFIQKHFPEEIIVSYLRGGEPSSVSLEPEEGIVEGVPAIGVAMDSIGIVSLPPHLAIWEGTKSTFSLLIAVTVGLATFLYDAVLGNADFSQVAGPVGIVGIVGDVSHLGFVYLLQFTAIISLNLAVINLLPIPALDGGRLLFVLIEAIKRSPIKPQVANTLNAVGFILLILLMLVVTFNDVLRLF